MKILILTLLLITNAIALNTASQIKFEGLTQISNKIAYETLNIKDGDTYTNKQINKAIKKFYKFNYFNDITIHDINNTLVIKFTEKPFIINIKMNGYKTSEDELKSLYTIMNIKKGNMFTKQRVENAKKELLKQLKLEGFVHSVVEVDIQQIDSKKVAITFNVNKGDEIIITKINYIGAKSLGESDFEDFTANKEEDLVSWWFGQNDGIMQFSQLQYDSHRIKDVYYQHGFLDVKVQPAYSTIDYNTNKAQIDFIINEGKQYKVNDILIYLNEEIIKVKDLNESLKLKKKKYFNIKKLRTDINYIKTQVSNKGYAYTQVNYDIRKNKKDFLVDIIINVIENEKVYINDVIIKNNTRTLDRIIRRDVYLAPNDLFNLTDLRDSKNKLNRTGFFKSVDIKQKRVSKNLMDLIVDVNEAPTGNLIIGGGYGSYDGWMLNASVEDKNIFGSGIGITFKLDHSKRKDSATISINNPSVYDSIYSGSFKVYNESSTISDYSAQLGDKDSDTRGFSLGIGRSLNRNTRIGLIYSLDNEVISYEKNSSSNDDYTTSAIKPYISYDSTDSYFVARTGIQTGTSLLYAGIGGDAKYLLNNTYFKYYLGLEDYLDYDVIFRVKSRIRTLQDLGNMKDKTFYMGGPSNLRGYESYSFRAINYNQYEHFKKSISNTIELSFPLMPKAQMRWALFYDFSSIGEDSYNDIKKSGYGLSLNWYSPVGPIQFIFSRANKPTQEDSDKTSNFEFSLGNKF